jgi:hypothetical protein
MNYVLCCLLFTTVNCYAQQGYVITKTGDTLTGKVTRGNLNRNRVTLSYINGTDKIHLRDLKEWSNGASRVIVVANTTGKRAYWVELKIEVDGKKRLFRDLFHVWGNNMYYFLYNGKYIQLTHQNIANLLKPDLMQCKTFAEEYRLQAIKQSELESVFRYYNRHCTEVTL